MVQRTHLFDISGCMTKLNDKQLHLFFPSLDFVGSQHWNVWRDARNDAFCTRKDLRWGGPVWNSDQLPAMLLCQSQGETERSQRGERTCVQINKAQVLCQCRNIQRGPTCWIDLDDGEESDVPLISLSLSLLTPSSCRDS